MDNYVIRAVNSDRNIRAFFSRTTKMIEDARKIHNTTPVVTAALGRTMTATAIMGLMLKEQKGKLTIQIKGNGPLKQILATGDSFGNVKGYVPNPNVDLPLRPDGKLDVGGAVGNKGSIIVIKDLGLREPYIGQSALVSGEIAEDITAYFANSEQQPSAVSLGVLIDRDQTVKASGGLIIQVMPGIDDETLEKLEEIVNKLPPITRIISLEKDDAEILKNIFGDIEMEILSKSEVRYLCDCSEERLEKALISVGKKDLEEIIKEDGKAELICHFCNTKYHFDKDHLERLLREAL